MSAKASRHKKYRVSLTDRGLERAIQNARDLVEFGERRIMDLENENEPDQREIAKNRVLLRSLLSHLRLLEGEQRGRKNHD